MRSALRTALALTSIFQIHGFSAPVPSGPTVGKLTEMASSDDEAGQKKKQLSIGEAAAHLRRAEDTAAASLDSGIMTDAMNTTAAAVGRLPGGKSLNYTVLKAIQGKRAADATTWAHAFFANQAPWMNERGESGKPQPTTVPVEEAVDWVMAAGGAFRGWSISFEDGSGIGWTRYSEAATYSENHPASKVTIAIPNSNSSDGDL